MKNINLRRISVGMVSVAVLSAPGSLFAAELNLEKVELLAVQDSQTKVVLLLNQAALSNAISSFDIKEPRQVVVDIPNASLSSTFDASTLSNEIVTSVKTEIIKEGDVETLRVTLFLSSDASHSLKSNGSTVEISIEKPIVDPMADYPIQSDSSDGSVRAAPAEPSQGYDFLGTDPNSNPYIAGYPSSGPEALPSGISLTSLDFDQQSSTSRVVIGVQGGKDFSHKKVHGDTIIVDIEDAFVPKSLSRVLDTAHFYSAVKMVRAYKYSGGARVSISLKEDIDYNITMAENVYILVDIPIPQSMQDEQLSAMQTATSVAPEDPEEGISNAYQREILIGEQGRTVDPQAAFGTGSGSQDPSALGMANGFMFDTTTSTDQSYTGQKISIDLVSADIHSLFRLISHVSKLNIITGDDVQGKVTVRMNNVPWDQALAAILQSKGLGSQRFGNIIRVAPIETIKAEQQSALETKRAQEELEELKLLVIPLNYAQASELEGQVRELLSSRGTLQVDQRGNQLILKDSERRLAQIRELIRHLDKQTPQVLIEARVVEATSQFSQMMGIEWGADVHANAATGYPTGLFFPNSIGMTGGISNQTGQAAFYDPNTSVGENLLVDLGAEGSNTGVAFSLGSIPGLINIDVRLSAMETDGWGKVVSEPRITTLDNKTARIEQGARVPFLSTSSGGTQVQFVEATLQLEVTPHITSDDQIFLALKVSNNRPDFSQLVQGQPAIQIKEAQTEVLIADGDTTVIGGVFASENSMSQDKVPGLHKI
ncbi:MAG: type IV pilus secretin PilQ, partial [Myxococcota bacterium]|nr:type IV pilus secretin PilQ [Myxococcota bacterium]